MSGKDNKPAFLIARTTAAKKAEFTRLAKREGLSVGALIRKLLEAYARGRREATN